VERVLGVELVRVGSVGGVGDVDVGHLEIELGTSWWRGVDLVVSEAASE
jgi:hypothetical protein